MLYFYFTCFRLPMPLYPVSVNSSTRYVYHFIFACITYFLFLLLVCVVTLFFVIRFFFYFSSNILYALFHFIHLICFGVLFLFVLFWTKARKIDEWIDRCCSARWQPQPSYMYIHIHIYVCVLWKFLELPWRIFF